MGGAEEIAYVGEKGQQREATLLMQREREVVNAHRPRTKGYGVL